VFSFLSLKIMAITLSAQTYYRAFNRVLAGGNLEDGAEFRSRPRQAFEWLCQLVTGDQTRGAKEVENKQNTLRGNATDIFRGILAINPDDIQGHGCVLNCGNCALKLKQEDGKLYISSMISEHSPDNEFGDLHEVHLVEKDKMLAKGMTFCALKSAALQKYINECDQADLSQIDLTGLDTSRIKFETAMLSRENIEQIIANGGGNLSGAVVRPGERVKDLDLSTVRIDQNMAKSLIDAGAVPERVCAKLHAENVEVDPQWVLDLPREDAGTRKILMKYVLERTPITLKQAFGRGGFIDKGADPKAVFANFELHGTFMGDGEALAFIENGVDPTRVLEHRLNCVARTNGSPADDISWVLYPKDKINFNNLDLRNYTFEDFMKFMPENSPSSAMIDPDLAGNRPYLLNLLNAKLHESVRDKIVKIVY
jgi:hypothetical protein